MRSLIDIYSGVWIYKKLTRKKSDTFFIFLLDNDPELNYYAIRHMKRYAEANGFSSAEIICSEAIFSDVQRFAENKYKISSLNEKQTKHLLGYVLMKSDAMGFPILKNIRLITLQHPNTGLSALYSQGFFDKEYLVWMKILCHRVNEYEELIRTDPYKISD